ncbi:MAG TPA: OsmC family protein [Steroidobacteraceae bacterium]|jgi:uncharacterized OsmC-like protein|nr:OsmC family protein [Steroidobacteraceae bacterium]
MSAQYVADAMQRVEVVLRRRPDMGMHDDSPATASWRGSTRIVTSHDNGIEVTTDMPNELGGTGDQVTPGWLMRAGLAACTATRIAMGAAAAGIELTKLELRASSRSDTRGMLGMTEPDGTRISAGPRDVELHVTIAAHGVPAEKLRALVEESHRCSPVPCAIQEETPVGLQIEVADS